MRSNISGNKSRLNERENTSRTFDAKNIKAV